MYQDAAALVIEHLSDMLTVPVVGKVPTTRPDEWVLVRLVGGARLNKVADEPRLAIEAWSTTDEDAHDLAQECRGLVWQLRGTTLDGVAVYRIQEASGPQNFPDPVSDQPRFTFSVQIALRGTADPAVGS